MVIAFRKIFMGLVRPTKLPPPTEHSPSNRVGIGDWHQGGKLRPHLWVGDTVVYASLRLLGVECPGQQGPCVW